MGAPQFVVAEEEGCATVAVECGACHGGTVYHPPSDGYPRGFCTRCECFYMARQAAAVSAARLPFGLVRLRGRDADAWRDEHPADPAAEADALRTMRREARAAVGRWTDGAAAGRGDARTIALVGPEGTGKTRLMVEAAWDVAKALGRTTPRRVLDGEAVPRVLYTRWSAWAKAYQDNTGKARSALGDAFARVPVLVLDEIGEPVIGWLAAEMREWLKGRSDARRWTLMASNHAPGRDDSGVERRGAWGHLTGAAALMDRIVFVPLAGPSWRGV